MARQYDIQTPDGKTITVEGPEDATDDELIAFAQSQIAASGSAQYAKGPVEVKKPQAAISPTPVEGKMTPGATKLKAAQDALGNSGGMQSILMNGASFGLSDEISGVANALGNIVSAPFTGDFNPSQAYTDARDVERGRIASALDQYPVAGNIGLILGGFAGGNPGAAVAAAPNALAAIRSGATTGAIGGAIGGFGSGNGTEESAVGGVLGGAFGGALGSAIPAAVSYAAPAVRGISRLMGREQAGLSRQIVGEALAADANTGASAGALMDRAHSLGVPYMLADTGENTRGLVASVGRQPGPSRTTVLNAVQERQMGQGDRIRSAIERDLGPVGNVGDVSDALIKRARDESRPLYEQAYAQNVTLTPEMMSLLDTPAGKRALMKARTTMANDRVDPMKMGIAINEAGEPEIARVPSLKTIDYVKGALDDIVEESRDPITGKLVLDREGSSVNGVLRDLLGRADEQVPTYAEARAAYAGPASERDALTKGQQAMRLSPDEIERQVRGMSPTQLEQYGLGYRSELANGLERRVDDADKARAALGTPRKRAALEAVMPGAGLDNFSETMAAEQIANQTYRSATQGSQTAERLAYDAQVTDPGLLESAGDSLLRGSKDGIWSAIVNGVMKVRETSRYGAGEAGKNVRQSVASLLTETDPAELSRIMAEANAEVLARQARSAQVAGTGAIAGGQLGRGLAVAGGNTNGR